MSELTHELLPLNCKERHIVTRLYEVITLRI
ncbi:hypothetical protein SERP0231 [Staphylococcus epidermidis RP62A]|uniref:Uncharacterized protein n=1 Tax=Staphylococcus epidermidis (strain ATCC 35984 / DSM 28319 / BCRC 17069 / CCUG 31568 / BM 3577 / RP62A) TaxID=176279 RepID=Q5HRG2_STAEQ|nr:hypothetical protein SERP0231 [Staphylococcus epidermidis RP62A]